MSLPLDSTKTFSNLTEIIRKHFSEKHKRPSATAQRPSSAPAQKPPQKRRRNAPIPIILVPPAPTARLTLWNVKQFLIGNQYIKTEDLVNQPKPERVVLERTLKANHAGGEHFPKVFHVVDAPEMIKEDEWSRVVGCFVTGQKWQFGRWRWREPAQIFSKVKGFCLKYADEPAPGDVLKWPIEILDVHRTHRHNDYQAINKFWDTVDQFIMREKRATFF
ncbi:RNA polymerase II accessory factor [Gaertneriomyces semiglobifer]|nr:RNA polymerase II accessory factor [Gaertneriomyces semiglobifer]